tara:strand:+ start:339 stop:590 length:252 start_codon:yes stop_codon:yes gene_type:complete
MNNNYTAYQKNVYKKLNPVFNKYTNSGMLPKKIQSKLINEFSMGVTASFLSMKRDEGKWHTLDSSTGDFKIKSKKSKPEKKKK